ncbi:MAG: hypothetical protein Q7S21_02745 [archaeon]|nr:hypothetical protein [archaeon]
MLAKKRTFVVGRRKTKPLRKNRFESFDGNFETYLMTNVHPVAEKKFKKHFKHFFVCTQTGKLKYLVELISSGVLSWLGVVAPKGRATRRDGSVCRLRLRFTSNSVIVNEMQGRKGMMSEILKLERIVGMPWNNFLVAQTERIAKESGIKFIAISNPETMHSFLYPVLPQGAVANIEVLHRVHGYDKARELMQTEEQKIRNRIKNLHHGVAKERKYVNIGLYFAKRL